MNDGGDTSATLPPRIGRYRVTGMLGAAPWAWFTALTMRRSTAK